MKEIKEIKKIKKPVVGVAALFDNKKDSIWMLPDYLDALQSEGALPIILPLKISDSEIELINNMCDGFLLTGGDDVTPSLYGEKALPVCGETNECRDFSEEKIFKTALKYDKPVLGICRGAQLINVLLGGSLYQDLPSMFKGKTNINHRMEKPYNQPWHKMKLVSDKPLSKLLNSEEIDVNSRHHQGIKILAPSLTCMAFSPDGLIEGFFMETKKFVWAVQWHPEHSYKTDENSKKIFREFIKNL